MAARPAPPPSAPPPGKTRAAKLSMLANSTLIAIKIAAGVLTGSVGILSDAVHSLMDLIASAIAFASVRKADEPADASHRYGHQKLEDLSASAQAMLLLLGAVFIAAEAIRRLIEGGRVSSIGVGIAVVAVAAAINLIVSTYLARRGRATESAALQANAADLRTDAFVSLGVLVSLILSKLTGARWIDPVVGLLVAGTISVTGVRILLGAGRRLADETLPVDELDRLRQVVESFLGEEVVGFHDLRARHVGSHHEVDLHLQFVAGTSLERAHDISHRLQDAIVDRLPGTTVLVHLEPEQRVRPDRFGDTGAVSAESARTRWDMANRGLRTGADPSWPPAAALESTWRVERRVTRKRTSAGESMAEKNEEQAEKEPAPIKESDASRVSQEEAERSPGREHAESEESETPNG